MGALEPIGKQIDDPVTVGPPTANGIPVTIIGIVPHTRNNAPGEKEEARNLPMMYFSASQFAKEEENLIVRAKAGFNPHALISPIRSEIAALDEIREALQEFADVDRRPMQIKKAFSKDSD